MTPIRAAVEAAAASWPPAGGDTNLFDVFHLAVTLSEHLAVDLPTALPPKAAGVAAFECVEANLLSDPAAKLTGRRPRVLRQTPADEIADRVETLSVALRGMLPFPDDQALVVSLYAWHGCIHMAKVLRRTANSPGGPEPYTPEMRRYGYAHVQQEWVREESLGNPWVRYGVTLARLMEKGRKGDQFATEVIEAWVPAGSPYWEE
jgi:hypothetical protein